jgi:class 3 adenylate cyclase/predicted ATPase
MDIVVWLRSLGLGKYEALFRENGIDETVLSDLTEVHLRELGISLGDRLKLLKAIAALGSPARPAEIPASKLTPVSDGLRRAEISPPVQPVGERRHITVMFCDLVGSTSISAGLDAEDWRDLVGSYLDAASAAVTEMGGHVAKKLGDGLMALFGYPVAQENDAERAARAALSIQRALAEVNRKSAGSGKPALNARIGIETGSVVVDASGEIYGDAPNTAARMQALAEPGTVVVTARVQRQVAGLFVAEERGAYDLKGVPEPVTLFQLVRASGGGRRAGQRHLTALVGREEEIAMLMRRWERARQGDGQLVLVVGEPGIGKSRMIEEFHARLRETPHTWSEWSCSQLLQNTPLHPIAEWGRQRFGGTDVPAKQRLGDLESSLVQVKLDPKANVPFLAPLLDIPLPPEPVPPLPPEEVRQRQLAALTNWVMAAARSQPIVLALEDVHWADPTTLDLFRGIAERGALAPLLVLITARPEFRPAWGARSHHGTISLVPLDRDQVRRMVSDLAARHALTKDVIEGVTERTGGVPLFIEEVTRLLLERGEQGGIQAIPPTLQQSLAARLDRLGPAREVAQVGAVVGRDFSYALLRSVAGMEDEPLQAALERLAEADILLVQGLPPASDYRFKHALIQDAAYENLLKSRRQVLHRCVGEVLRDQFAASAAAEPELLARHFTQAGLIEAAIEWWGKAGQRSLERSALVEGIGHLARALDQFALLPRSPASRREQIKLQVALISPLIHVKGFAAPETKAAVEKAKLLIEEAEKLGEHVEDPLLLFTVLYGLWIGHYVAFDGDVVRKLAEQFLALAQKQAEAVPVMIGHRAMGHALLLTGHFVKSRAHYDEALRLYVPVKHALAAARVGGQDARVAVLVHRARALWLLGYPEAALADTAQGVRHAREIEHAATLMFALDHASVTYLHCGDNDSADALLTELAKLVDEKGAAFWKAFGLMTQGALRLLRGKASDAVRLLTTGLKAYQSTGATVFVPWYLTYLATAYGSLSQYDNAQRMISEAIEAIDRTNERWCEAEVLRVAGEVALLGPEQDSADAQKHFERAFAVAGQQQAKSWELRTSISLARLWRDQGKVQQARELLAPVYGWFTEGFDTRDLKEAKALLGTLAK